MIPRTRCHRRRTGSYFGTVAAGLFGHRVALVENAPTIGGAGLNSGTVPSKTLRETALALSGWQSRRLFGVDLSLRRETTVADFTRDKDAVSERDAPGSRCRSVQPPIRRWVTSTSSQPTMRSYNAPPVDDGRCYGH